MSRLEFNAERLFKIIAGQWKRMPMTWFDYPVEFKPTERYSEVGADSYSWYHTLMYDGIGPPEGLNNRVEQLKDDLDRLMEAAGEAMGKHLRLNWKHEGVSARLEPGWAQSSIDAIHQLICEVGPKVFAGEAPYGNYLSKTKIRVQVKVDREIGFRLHFRFVIWPDGLTIVKPEVSVAGYHKSVADEVWHSSNEYLPNDGNDEANGLLN